MQPSELDARRTLPVAAVQRAQLLAGAVHDRDPEAIETLLLSLDRQELLDLVVTAAAMIPVDVSPTDLLRWNDLEVQETRYLPRILAPCGTRSAYERHRRNGELPDEACVLANRDHYRGRYRRQKLELLTGGAR